MARSPGKSDRLWSQLQDRGLLVEQLSIPTGATGIQPWLSPGESPAAPGSQPAPRPPWSLCGDQHGESMKGFKSSSTSYRNAEDERNGASKSRQTDGFYGARNTIKKKSGSSELFEGVKHQLERKQRQRAGGRGRGAQGIASPGHGSSVVPGSSRPPPAPETRAGALPSPTVGTSRCQKNLTA